MLSFHEIKSLWGLRLILFCSKSLVACCIIIAVMSVVEICLNGDGFMSIEEMLTRGSSTSSHFLLLTSFSGPPALFRRVLPSILMLVLARMCVLGVIKSVMVYGTVGIVGQLG